MSVRTENYLGRARAYAAGLGRALATEPVAGQEVFARVVARWAAAAGLVDAVWVREQDSTRLVAAYTSSIRGELHPGADVSDWSGLAAAVRDRASVFAVSASTVGLLDGESGFYLVQAGDFGPGPRRTGFLAAFIPRGWLASLLEEDPRRFELSLAGRRLDGALDSPPAASTSFDALGRRWMIEVARAPSTRLQAILPWLALSWPPAAALVVFLIGRAIVLRRRAERDVERMFDVSIDAMCVAGMDGYFKRVNPGYARMLGYSPEELLSRPFFDFIPSGDHERARRAMEALARGEKVTEVELRNIASDGSERWLQWNTQPVLDEGLLYATARDVTDRRRAAEEDAALRRVATLVARGESPTDVLNAVAAEVGRLLGADATRLLRYEPVGAVTVLATSGELHAEVGMRLSLDGENLAASVLRTGRPARIESLENASGSIAAWARARGIRSGVGAPITVEGRLWGLIVAVWTTHDLPSAEDAESRMAAFTELVATAIANAQSRAELTASRARVVQAADETRRRIGRDLHDGTQQQLVALGFALRRAGAKVPTEFSALRADLTEIADDLAVAIEDLRELSRGIHPAVLTQGGLEPALKNLARRSALPVELDLRVGVRLPERVEVAAYYVVSEALTNVGKHARASAVRVKVDMDDSTVELAIHDDGVGGADPRGGSGLIGLRDRVEAVGGTMEVTSIRGEGTSLLVTIPTIAVQPESNGVRASDA